MLRILGPMLIVLGILIATFSETIVFPGIEILLGIETIVGRENVSYQPDGSYYFTNPGAMFRWVASVTGVGLLISALGIVMVIKARRRRQSLRLEIAS